MAYTAIPAGAGGGNFTAGSGFQYLTITTDNLVLGASAAQTSAVDGGALKLAMLGSSSRKLGGSVEGAAGGCFWETSNGTIATFFGHISSGSAGYVATASAHAMKFRTANTDRAQIFAGGGGELGVGALATTATAGYWAITTCAGAPTGVPAGYTAGMVAIQFDSTNNRLYVYDGAWISVALA
jgi:hypothetical protein